ncbi:DUF1654 domain-containing protein [Salinicola sp. JS01]|uniref:DUF1654 domain-containing protein n=1 Tax=Salinicola sp. JS01 TaxID=3050071 RepID=UPI00255BBBE6|nr:DUF1654 domain-containing protein [Salinicola sp. JS01]WIX31401.1 DUF1654 domain-containing protein [Salinicola sp. JS01]
MILAFPSPYERLSRRVSRAIQSATCHRRQQLVIMRQPGETQDDWSRLMARLAREAAVSVISITADDILLSWRARATESA